MCIAHLTVSLLPVGPVYADDSKKFYQAGRQTILGDQHSRPSGNSQITTVAEAQELTIMHFAVCITNPDMIRRRLERQAEIAHRRQMNKAAETQAANELRAVYDRASPSPQSLTRPTQA